LELTISLPDGDERIALVGAAERNLKIIREALGVTITARNGDLKVSGESSAVGRAANVLEALGEAARRHRTVERQQLLDLIANSNRRSYAPAMVMGGVHPVGSAGQRSGDDSNFGSTIDGGLDVYSRGRRVAAITEGQRHYLDAIGHHDLTFCSGPAGTGKTYLAVAAAAAMLKRGSVRKLVLVRPAVEAGEKLGFLPGDLQAKVNPYLRPLLDALHDMMDFEQIQRFMACDLIEVIPLAFMRGRTLNDSLVILDEAQNTTRAQMMMFLTRLGHGSKMIVTGDTSQIDLPDPRQSGLIDAVHRLRRVKGVAIIALEQSDIVRHNLVQRIVEAYEPSPKKAQAATHEHESQE